MTRALFGHRTTILLVLVAALSLVTGILFIVLGPELSSPPSFQSDTYSRSAVGHRAFVELLRGLDVPVLAVRSHTAARARSASLLVIAEPDLRGADPARRARLDQMLAQAPRVLLVLPKWYATAEPGGHGWIREAALREDAAVETVLREANPRLSLLYPAAALLGPWDGQVGASPALERPQLAKPDPDLEPLLSSREGVLFGLLPHGRTHLYLLTDPDVIETHGLHRGENALLAARAIEIAREGTDGPVLFDETLHGFELEPSAWRELFRFPLSLALVQVVISTLVLLWAGMSRFGAPVKAPPAIEPGKRFLVESTADLLLRGGHAPHALERYLHGTVQDVARGTHAPATLAPAALREWLARVAEARGVRATVGDLEREVAEAAAAGAKEPRRIVAAALSVHGWRKEMIDGPVRDS